MNKKLLYFLIACICISLVGISLVQFLWIRNAFQIKEAQFKRSVNEALGGVVNSLETRENMRFISRNFEGDSIMSIVQAFSRDTNQILKGKLDSLLALNETEYSPPKTPKPSKIVRRNYIHTLPPGAIQYSYRLQINPDPMVFDTIIMNVDGARQEIGNTENLEFDFSWEEQVREMDSIFELNQKLFELQTTGEAFPDVFVFPGMNRKK